MVLCANPNREEVFLMFADPQTVTVASVAKTLPAVSRTLDTSVYKMYTGDYSLTITKSRNASRKRFNVRLDARKIASDPMMSSINVVSNASVAFAFNLPLNGTFSNAEGKDIALALGAWMTSANALKVLGEET
jgi:hypothetical protein